jgi:alpha-amylase
MDTAHRIVRDEVNQIAPHMRLGLEAWGEWLMSVVGFEGSRFDVSSSVEPWYMAEWLSRPAISGKFAVLEHDNGASPRELQTYAQLVDGRATVFDFTLRTKLAEMCTNATFNISQMYRAGVAGVAPEFAVTFVENHDKIRPCFDDKVGIETNKVLAYAYILISEGLPCVFYHDYYELPDAILTNKFFQCQGGKNDAFRGEPLKPRIDRLIQARKLYAAGSTMFISDSNSNHVYVAKRTGGGPSNKAGCVLAINRAPTNITVTVSTGFSSTNLVDRVDTNMPLFSVTTSASGTATFGVPGKGYRVLAP